MVNSRCLSAVSILLSVAASAPGGAMMAAPDETPLLWDRVQSFPAVVVATPVEGFEKKPAPVRGTNSVYLPVKIVTVLKGDLKPGDFRLSVHERLPALLVERDGNAASRRYLLVLGLDKGTGYLGAGQVFADLERFYPADAGLEKVAKAFIEANDTGTAAVFKLAGALLADKDVSASPLASGHVYALLGSLAAKSDQDELKALDANLAASTRKWLAGEANTPEQSWRPDYVRSPVLAPVIELLGRLKDRAAKDLLIGLAKESRWRDLRKPLLAALKEILTAEEFGGLDLPAPEPPPGIRPLPGRRLPPPQIRGGPEPLGPPTDD